MRNNNRSAIGKLARRCFTANRSRNFFAFAAVLLTTVLVTAVFTIGISLNDGMKEMLMQTAGRSSQIEFQYLTEEEVQRLAAQPEIAAYGLSTIVGDDSSGIFAQTPCEIRTADPAFAAFSYSTPTTGRLPQADNEVAVKSWMLDAMGLPRELGQTIALDCQVGETLHHLKLVVCGFWDSDIHLQPYGFAFISDALAKTLLVGTDPAQGRWTGDYSGVIQMSTDLTGWAGDLDERAVAIATAADLPDIISVLVNPAFSPEGSLGEMAAVLVLVVAIILISGYLLIYNIFYISVIRDVKFYGLLRTVGATQKQIKGIVHFQALLLCAVGIPVGLFLGYLMGILLIPVLLSFLQFDYIATAANPLIFLLGAALSLFTVFISCHGPARRAGRISPVAALRYSGDIQSLRRRKGGRRGAKLHRMALANLRRSRKKTALVIASISLGLILFNIFFTLVYSFDTDKFLAGYIRGDFLVAETSYFNLADSRAPEAGLGEDLLRQLQSLEGVDDVAKVYYGGASTPLTANLAARMQEAFSADEELRRIFSAEEREQYAAEGSILHGQLYGFDEYWLDTLADSIVAGNFDREKFLSGDYLIIGSDRQNLFAVGDTVSLSIGGGEARQYTVLAKAAPASLYALSVHFTNIPGFAAYLPAAVLDGTGDVLCMSATVFAQEENLSTVQAQLDALAGGNDAIDFRSRSDYLEEMAGQNRQFALIGFTLCAVVLMIGVLNYVNTIITNIMARKQELAMLQSIGMTGRQMKKLLILECLSYLGCSLLVFVTAGYALSAWLVSSFAEASAAYTYQFTILPLLIAFVPLFLLGIITPLAAAGSLGKESLIERLREAE